MSICRDLYREAVLQQNRYQRIRQNSLQKALQNVVRAVVRLGPSNMEAGAEPAVQTCSEAEKAEARTLKDILPRTYDRMFQYLFLQALTFNLLCVLANKGLANRLHGV
jgi:hypothetical protein